MKNAVKLCLMHVEKSGIIKIDNYVSKEKSEKGKELEERNVMGMEDMYGLIARYMNAKIGYIRLVVTDTEV